MQHMSRQQIIEWLNQFPVDQLFDVNGEVETRYNCDGNEFVPNGAKFTTSISYPVHRSQHDVEQ